MNAVLMILAFLAGLGLYGLIAWLMRRARRPAHTIGTYDEIKASIRDGTVKPVQGADSGPEVETLDAIFAYESGHEFTSALGWRLASRWLDDEHLTPAETLLHAVYQLDCEICNGGFDQYFFNSAGDDASEALEGLRAMDEPKLAEILASAVALLQGGRAEEARDERWEQLEALSEAERHRMHDLTRAWFGQHDGLSDAMMRFARAHRAELT